MGIRAEALLQQGILIERTPTAWEVGVARVVGLVRGAGIAFGFWAVAHTPIRRTHLCVRLHADEASFSPVMVVVFVALLQGGMDRCHCCAAASPPSSPFVSLSLSLSLFLLSPHNCTHAPG